MFEEKYYSFKIYQYYKEYLGKYRILILSFWESMEELNFYSTCTVNS